MGALPVVIKPSSTWLSTCDAHILWTADEKVLRVGGIELALVMVRRTEEVAITARKRGLVADALIHRIGREKNTGHR